MTNRNSWIVAGAIIGLILLIGIFTDDPAVTNIIEQSENIRPETLKKIELTAIERNKLAQFITGNVVWTMYHEAGHAFTSMYNIPILGMEEDAADNFATIILLLYETELFNKYLEETVYAWFLLDEFAEIAGFELNFADEHGLDQQRAYQTLCLIYGADKSRFEAFAKFMNMPEYRLKKCEYEFNRVSESWGSVLRANEMVEGDSNYEINITYEEPTDGFAVYKDMLEKSLILEDVRGYFRHNYKLPYEINMVAKNCGAPNAYWDSNAKQITMCYELLAELEKLYRFDIQQAITEEKAN